MKKNLPLIVIIASAILIIVNFIMSEEIKDNQTPEVPEEKEIKKTEEVIAEETAEVKTEEVKVEETVAEEVKEDKPKSLNDTLFKNNLQIGLNDRIAFVKHLFDGSQEDFNRVVSQLNSFKTQKEAKKFINKMVKPDYDWADKEEIEERFMTIIERKFL